MPFHGTAVSTSATAPCPACPALHPLCISIHRHQHTTGTGRQRPHHFSQRPSSFIHAFPIIPSFPPLLPNNQLPTSTTGHRLPPTALNLLPIMCTIICTIHTSTTINTQRRRPSRLGNVYGKSQHGAESFPRATGEVSNALIVLTRRAAAKPGTEKNLFFFYKPGEPKGKPQATGTKDQKGPGTERQKTRDRDRDQDGKAVRAPTSARNGGPNQRSCDPQQQKGNPPSPP